MKKWRLGSLNKVSFQFCLAIRWQKVSRGCSWKDSHERTCGVWNVFMSGHREIEMICMKDMVTSAGITSWRSQNWGTGMEHMWVYSSSRLNLLMTFKNHVFQVIFVLCDVLFIWIHFSFLFSFSMITLPSSPLLHTAYFKLQWEDWVKKQMELILQTLPTNCGLTVTQIWNNL
jgi:hypothetical protein